VAKTEKMRAACRRGGRQDKKMERPVKLASPFFKKLLRCYFFAFLAAGFFLAAFFGAAFFLAVAMVLPP
jgi:hypothetical protein